MSRSWLIGGRVCLVGALIGSFVTGFQDAAATVSLRISPVLVELSATPGSAGSQEFIVVNEGDEPVDLAIAVEPYQAATGEWSAQDWLAVDQSQVALAPGDDATVTVAIRVPNDVASGGRYAMVTFATGPQGASEQGVAIAGKLGAALLIAVDGGGELASKVAIEQFGPVLESDGRIGFRAVLKNSGNLHALPAGQVEIETADGEPFGRLDVPMATPLLPGGELEVAAQGTLPMPSGTRYRARATIDVGGGKSVTADAEFSPDALIAVDQTAVCENLDRAPTATVVLRNDGALGLQPLVQIAVRDAASAVLGAPVAASAPVIWPGESGEIQMDLPTRLASGAYTLDVRVDYAAPDAQGRTAIAPVERQTPFAIGGLGADAAPLCPPTA